MLWKAPDHERIITNRPEVFVRSLTMALFESVILISTILFLLYKYGTRNFQRWKGVGIKYDEPYPFIGSDLNIFTKERSPCDNVKRMYDKYNER